MFREGRSSEGFDDDGTLDERLLVLLAFVLIVDVVDEVAEMPVDVDFFRSESFLFVVTAFASDGFVSVFVDSSGRVAEKEKERKLICLRIHSVMQLTRTLLTCGTFGNRVRGRVQGEITRINDDHILVFLLIVTVHSKIAEEMCRARRCCVGD